MSDFCPLCVFGVDGDCVIVLRAHAIGSPSNVHLASGCYQWFDAWRCPACWDDNYVEFSILFVTSQDRNAFLEL